MFDLQTIRERGLIAEHTSWRISWDLGRRRRGERRGEVGQFVGEGFRFRSWTDTGRIEGSDLDIAFVDVQLFDLEGSDKSYVLFSGIKLIHKADDFFLGGSRAPAIVDFWVAVALAIPVKRYSRNRIRFTFATKAVACFCCGLAKKDFAFDDVRKVLQLEEETARRALGFNDITGTDLSERTGQGVAVAGVDVVTFNESFTDGNRVKRFIWFIMEQSDEEGAKIHLLAIVASSERNRSAFLGRRRWTSKVAFHTLSQLGHEGKGNEDILHGGRRNHS